MAISLFICVTQTGHWIDSETLRGYGSIFFAMDIKSYDYVIMNDYVNHSGADTMLIWEDLVFSVDDYDLVQIARASAAVLLIV